jgi:hypothetical protein
MSRIPAYLAASVFGLVILSFVSSFFIATIGRASGQHQVFVTAVETTGILWSVDSAYVKTDLGTTQEDVYCVIDPGVKAALAQASIEKRPVTLHYQNDLVVFAWDCASSVQSIIVSID